MGHYKSNVRDIEFNLFEVLGLDAVLGQGRYSDLDRDTVHTMLGEVARLAEGPVADSFVEADREPPTFDPETHTVNVPAGIVKSVQAVKEAEYWRMGLDPEIGGMPAPAAVVWGVNELLWCANPSVAFYYNLGPAMANALYIEGNEEQRRWAAAGLERGWSATMVLTEADAGSDVGAQRTKATQQADGTWHIEGVKRFISGGDVGETAENIFHLVLARPEGAGPGTKGLSLFYVPKYLFDRETMELKSRNGAYVTNLEHKMGLKASPTCEVSFGVHGTPRWATSWAGCITDCADVHRHRACADDDRRQGRRHAVDRLPECVGLRQGTGPGRRAVADHEQDRAAGDDHAPPDVRRSLITQKAYAEGLRALYMYAAAHQNADVAQAVLGIDADLAQRVDDPLLPIVKGVGSERAYQILTESLQTLGGSGFLQDYPIEQYIRDAKIDSPVRRHHRDPGTGPDLPKDIPRQGRIIDAPRRPDQRVDHIMRSCAGRGRFPACRPP